MLNNKWTYLKRINLKRYSWCSDSLFDENYSGSTNLVLDDLIPFESKDLSNRKKKQRIVVGHSVGFDRSYIKEQYFLQVKKLIINFFNK